MKRGHIYRGRLIIVSTTVLCGLLSACIHDTVNPESLPEVCFETQVLPVFQSSCGTTGCHSTEDHHEYIFTDYDNILKAIKEGKPDQSVAYIAITASHGEKMMPPSQPLSQNNRMLIRAWIEQGALKTTCSDTSVVTDTTVTDTTTYWSNPYACFERDILPIMRSTCAMANCHDAYTHEEGYVFETYAGTMKAVVAGYPASSKLYKVITAANGEDRMPPSPYPSLSSAQIDTIYNWIARGALDEDCGTMCDTTSEVTYSAVVSPLITANCKGCHSGTFPSGGIRLESYSDIAVIAANGKLTGVLRGKAGYVAMPPAGPLNDCAIRQVELWVDAGYKDN